MIPGHVAAVLPRLRQRPRQTAGERALIGAAIAAGKFRRRDGSVGAVTLCPAGGFEPPLSDWDRTSFVGRLREMSSPSSAGKLSKKDRAAANVGGKKGRKSQGRNLREQARARLAKLTDAIDAGVPHEEAARAAGYASWKTAASRLAHARGGELPEKYRLPQTRYAAIPPETVHAAASLRQAGKEWSDIAGSFGIHVDRLRKAVLAAHPGIKNKRGRNERA